MTSNELFMEALDKRRIDFDYLCARANQLRCLENIAKNEDARSALLADIEAQVGKIAVDCWLDAGGRS